MQLFSVEATTSVYRGVHNGISMNVDVHGVQHDSRTGNWHNDQLLGPQRRSCTITRINATCYWHSWRNSHNIDVNTRPPGPRNGLSDMLMYSSPKSCSPQELNWTESQLTPFYWPIIHGMIINKKNISQWAKASLRNKCFFIETTKNQCFWKIQNNLCSMTNVRCRKVYHTSDNVATVRRFRPRLIGALSSALFKLSLNKSFNYGMQDLTNNFRMPKYPQKQSNQIFKKWNI